MTADTQTASGTPGGPRAASPVSYSYARQKGVAFRPGESAAFLVRSNADRRALIELRRVVGCTHPLVECDPAMSGAVSENAATDGMDDDG